MSSFSLLSSHRPPFTGHFSPDAISPFPALTVANAKTSALVLFAHGARDAEWSEPFRAIRHTVAERRPDLTVELAFLELMRPALGECIAELARSGHSAITIAPLFLAQGGHLKKDLPRIVAGLSAEHPSIEIAVLAPIGEVTELLNAIADWLVKSAPR
jgi:sirohydrochlorin cobaltochelatase